MDNEGKDVRWSHMTSAGETEVERIQSVVKGREREHEAEHTSNILKHFCCLVN